jgi:hypothetical protein
MREYILGSKIYRRLLSKYKKVLPGITYTFPVELMLIAYSINGIIKYPSCFDYPQRNVDKKCALNVLERGGYVIRINRFKRHYRLTDAGRMYCKTVIDDIKQGFEAAGLEYPF